MSDTVSIFGHNKLLRRLRRMRQAQTKLYQDIERFRKRCSHTDIWQARWQRSRRDPGWPPCSETWVGRICMSCGTTEEQGHEVYTFEVLTAGPVKVISKPDYMRYKSMKIPVIQKQ